MAVHVRYLALERFNLLLEHPELFFQAANVRLLGGHLFGQGHDLLLLILESSLQSFRASLAIAEFSTQFRKLLPAIGKFLFES
ncbi:hypothetical protein HG531_002446 [Fusarium graminearum]|nr:hypothetical protein HG531_002446 [Fusarium graminearum]